MTEDTNRDQLDPGAEERYLARLLLTATTSDLRDEALGQVQPEDFASGHLAGLWATAQKLAANDQPITRRNLITHAEGPSVEHTLHRLGDTAPHPANFAAAVAEVQRCGQLRRLIDTTVRIQQRALSAEDPSQALAAAHDELNTLDAADANDGDTRSYAQLLTAFETAMRSPTEKHTIIPTPWPEMNDRIAGGLHPGRLYVVGATTGHGKSIVAHQLAEHAASQHHPALVFSVEMDNLEVTGRSVANGATIEMGEISRRSLSDQSWQAFHEYRNRAQDYPLFSNDRPGLTLAYVKSECRAQQRRTGLSVIVVDYLQLLHTDRNVSREREVAHISRTLKQLSRELHAAIVVPAQLNRRPTERGKPLLSDLRESGAIEQDADVVMLLARQFHTDGDQAGKPTGSITVDIQKNRHGSVGDLELMWRGHYARIG